MMFEGVRGGLTAAFHAEGDIAVDSIMLKTLGGKENLWLSIK